MSSTPYSESLVRPPSLGRKHTAHYGKTGLSLIGYPGLLDIDPVYCMPASVIEKKGLRKGWAALARRDAWP